MPAQPAPARPITSVLVPDLERVRQFLTEMIAKGAWLALIEAILALLVRMRDLNTELVQKLAHHRRAKPPNEKLRRLQQELPFLREGAANDGTEPAGKGKSRSKDKKKTGERNHHKHARPKLPEHLRRVPEVHRVPDAERICPNCHVQIETIGHKCCEKLDIEPAKFVVKTVQREVGACPQCHLYVRTAPRGDEVLDRGILGNELLVQSLVDHYADATPWERMARSARREGVPLAANTLAASVGRVIDLMDPVVRHITEQTFSSAYTAMDATGMPVLDEEHPLGVRSGSLWLIEGDGRWATFVYAPSGHSVHLAAILKGYQLSTVLCDGSSTLNCVERKGAKRAGCWSHGRRGLVDALRLGDHRALNGLEIIAALFQIEAESKKGGETFEQRLARRQRESAPRIATLRTWVDDRLKEVEPRCVLGRAVGYLDRQWGRLTQFLQDGGLELTNNEVERDLRTWVLDRKTWFFVGHDQSARRTADALTILTTCRKFGIDPVRYLRDTLRKILDGEKSLAALLPENYVPNGSRSTLAG